MFLAVAFIFFYLFFFFNDTAPTEIYTLSLHDALPISIRFSRTKRRRRPHPPLLPPGLHPRQRPDRKSTRLNSSHVSISYAVFCLKKKNSILNLFPFNVQFRQLLADILEQSSSPSSLPP